MKGQANCYLTCIRCGGHPGKHKATNGLRWR
jgi:hypothetical protein